MRLLIVSNRLPVVVSKNDKGYELKKSAGGLVSGLTDYLHSLNKSDTVIDDFLWLGWPGMSIESKDQDLIRMEVNKVFKAKPVFFSQTLMDKVYLGFCNKTLWPLFHYFLNYTTYDRDYWLQYKRHNKIFCDEILKIIRPDDYIWVHDYHLMLLPALLREKISNPIGFFLHIPFPTFEIYRTLQNDVRKEILEGLMGSDLIGFHTHDYAQYFLRCVLRILGLENHIGEVEYNGRLVKVSTFPMGIDYEKFHAMNVAPFNDEKNQSNEEKIVLSVDRLDYSKGIINRLLGFELFLKKHPKWHNKVHMKMIVVPSRTGVPSYQRIKRKLDELVGKINGRYSNTNWTPIFYQYTSLPHKELISLYRRSNVSLLTPLRDGMNLVAKEYVASLQDKKGVLILSEFTGAAKELNESIVINPYNIEEIANAIEEALNLPEPEQIRCNQAMQQRLQRYNVTFWANDFVNQLHEMYRMSVSSLKKKKFTSQIQHDILERYRDAKHRIVVTNYDRVLVPFSGEFNSVEPTEFLKKIIAEITGNENTDLVINSGRSRKYLDKWLGDLDINMTAEHGTWVKDADTNKWTLMKKVSTEWKEEIMPILEMYNDRLPGASIEEKEYSVAWHYIKADVEQSSFISKELFDNLVSITHNMNIRVEYGSQAIEIYHAGIDKSEIVKYFLDKKKYDFIFLIGNNWSDEELYRILPDHSYSVNIGNIYTDANFMIKDHSEALFFLKSMAETI